jgi:hypothetical protein
VSPTPVADLARSQKATPTTAFTNGYQDFVGSQRLRIWYSPQTGAQWANAEFANKWVPALGLATSSQRWVNGANRVDFQRGVMTWRPFIGVKVYLSQ